MAEYYVSNNGSDDNTGTSEDAAFATLSRLDGINLQPGDSILLDAGSVFIDTLRLSHHDDGSAEAPLVIGAYGEGDAPVITTLAGPGIMASHADHIIVEDISFATTAQAAIRGWWSNDWIVRNVTFDGSGGTDRADNTINWNNGSNITIENVTMHNSVGDGIFMRDMENVIVRDSLFLGTSTYNADNIQIGGDHIAIIDNYMLAGTNGIVNKGNLVLQGGEHAYVHGNMLNGGGFGASLSMDHVVFDGNISTGHHQYDWSFGLGLTDDGNGDVTHDIAITNNVFGTNERGININGGQDMYDSNGHQTIYGLDISDNVFFYDTKQPVNVVHSTLHGEITDNIHFHDAGAMTLFSQPSADRMVDDVFQFNNMHATEAESLPDIITAAGAVIGQKALDIVPVLVQPEIVPELAAIEDVSVADAQDGVTLVIEASGTMYDGSPIMRVRVNDDVVHEVAVDADDALGESGFYEIQLDSLTVDDALKVSFINDAHDVSIGQDRNLYVHEVSLNGEVLSLTDASGTRKVSQSSDKVSFYSNGTLTFDAIEVAQADIADVPDVVDIPELEIIDTAIDDVIDVIDTTLSHITVTASGMEHDGSPIMALFVNEIEVGRADVTADYTSGMSDMYHFATDRIAADDSVKVRFVNDVFDSATGGDRNLYVHEMTIDGVEMPLEDTVRSKKITYTDDVVAFYTNGYMEMTGADVQDANGYNDIAAIIDVLITPEHFLQSGDNAGHGLGVGGPLDIVDFAAADATFAALQDGMYDLL